MNIIAMQLVLGGAGRPTRRQHAAFPSARQHDRRAIAAGDGRIAGDGASRLSAEGIDGKDPHPMAEELVLLVRDIVVPESWQTEGAYLHGQQSSARMPDGSGAGEIRGLLVELDALTVDPCGPGGLISVIPVVGEQSARPRRPHVAEPVVALPTWRVAVADLWRAKCAGAAQGFFVSGKNIFLAATPWSICTYEY